jgi:hypothetical protein
MREQADMVTQCTKRLVLSCFLSSAIGAALALFAYPVLDRSNDVPAQAQERSGHPKTLRVLDVMHEFQTYSTKLFHAGHARNHELASWYHWKLKSAQNEITQQHTEPYAFNGWDAAKLAVMLDSPLEELKNAIENKQWDRFDERFAVVMQACNACHVATEHSFVVVQPPGDDQLPGNQRFDKD